MNNKYQNKQDNTIFVGNKNFSNYINAVYKSINNGHKSINICARGKYMSRAIDLALCQYGSRIIIKNIIINKEKLINKQGIENNVSSIKIELDIT